MSPKKRCVLSLAPMSDGKMSGEIVSDFNNIETMLQENPEANIGIVPQANQVVFEISGATDGVEGAEKFAELPFLANGPRRFCLLNTRRSGGEGMLQIDPVGNIYFDKIYEVRRRNFDLVKLRGVPCPEWLEKEIFDRADTLKAENPSSHSANDEEPEKQEAIERSCVKNLPNFVGNAGAGQQLIHPGFSISKFQITVPVHATPEQRESIRRPTRQEFFYVWPGPEWVVSVFLIRTEQDNKYYLLDPELVKEVPDDANPYQLFVCSTRDGEIFIFPIRLPSDGFDSEWWRSSREAVTIYAGMWIRLISKKEGYYEVRAAGAQPPPPPTNFRDMESLLQALIPNERIISNFDHPVLASLWGFS